MKSFFDLKPHDILDSVDSLGLQTTAELIQLNSYENRVFDVGVEPSPLVFNANRIIAKFYRPNRWTYEAILEEHQFLKELAIEGIPAVTPIEFNNGSTIKNCDGIFMTIFPKVKGRMPQEFLKNELKQVGRRLAQIHNIGERRHTKHRPFVGTDGYGGWESLKRLSNVIVPELWTRYEDAAIEILEHVEDSLIHSQQFTRIHGDCHKGNLLHTGDEFFFVDFDDLCVGPAVQDFWMLIPGEDDHSKIERDELIEGYEELRNFNHEEWEIVPLLKALRIIGYSAWIAQRWEDPSFPKLFPDFHSYKYWAIETESLEKIAWSL